MAERTEQFRYDVSHAWEAAEKGFPYVAIDYLDRAEAAAGYAGDPVGIGQALREKAILYNKLGDLDMAAESAGRSLETLEAAEEVPPEEVDASRYWRLRVLTRVAVQNELQGHAELRNFTNAHLFAGIWSNIRQREAKRQDTAFSGTPWPISVEPVRINMASRHAINDTLFGRAERARELTFRAIGLSLLMSGNPLLSSATDEKMGFIARVKRSASDIVAAAEAGLVWVLATEKQSRRRKLALKIADRALR